MTPTSNNQPQDAIGTFEMCNPHLIPEDLLITHLTRKFSLNLTNKSRGQIVELFSSHISPKEQRIHRENKRGVLLKRLQRSTVKKNSPDNPKHFMLADNNCQTNVNKASINMQKDKRSPSEPEGPEPKRSKITWP
eukprot:GFUD01073382.1.p1 GENE.GFUD01073382.1~~GFUD01073382.1.p1  ORF type:complete len:135 (+),score=24.11 GFUD01073382.1:44-448(+)